jgi:predicted restriction endonuclease
MLRETAALEQSAAVEQGREARFRLTVIPACNDTCALTGYRLVTVTNGSIVNAAHIHQFADSAHFCRCPASPRFRFPLSKFLPFPHLALSKNAHWLFDIGL